MAFDVVPIAPWPVIDGNSCVEFGWITVNKVNSMYTHMNEEDILSDFFKMSFRA